MRRVLWSVWSRVWSWAWWLVRSSICLILVGWLLTIPAWSETLVPSEPDWPELESCLGEIESGLNMIDLPLSEIESNLPERERNLSEREAASIKKEKQLSETELRLQQRELDLNDRELDLNDRESLYDDMQLSLQAAQKEFRRQKIKTWVYVLLTAAVAGAAGYGIGRMGK